MMSRILFRDGCPYCSITLFVQGKTTHESDLNSLPGQSIFNLCCLFDSRMSHSDDPGKFLESRILHLRNGLDVLQRCYNQKAWKRNQRILVHTKIMHLFMDIPWNRHRPIADGTTHAINIPFVSEKISGFHTLSNTPDCSGCDITNTQGN